MTEQERQAFEADLQAVLDYLDNPPEPGSPEDEEFGRLMARVEQGESEYTAEPQAEPPAIHAEVRQRLAALRAASQPPEPSRFTEGDGMGPTLGMDVGRS